MEIYIMEIGKKIKKKEKENIYIIMIVNLQVYIKKINHIMEMDIYIMKMEIYIMVILRME